jgi:hypothetical protein
MRDSDGNLVDYKNGNYGNISNFEYTLCQLFPKIARGLRETEYFSCMGDDGALSNHIPYPVGTKPEKIIPFADSQLGGILKTYREFISSGDTIWLKKIWPYIKHSLDYSFKTDSVMKWDPERKGIFEGVQDTLFGKENGANYYTQSLYTLSLFVASKMAQILKEKDIANEYFFLYERAKDYLYGSLNCDSSKATDLLSHWYSDNLGTDGVFDKQKLVSSLNRIVDGGSLKQDDICFYPAICLMLQNGLEEKALGLLENVNYDGFCANKLSSYTLINAACGLNFDMHKESISFNPILDFSKDGYFNCVFSAGEAFGMVEVGPRYIEIKTLSGQFRLRSFGLFKEPKVVYYAGRKFDFKACGNTAVFDVSLICNKEKSIQIIFD